LGLLVVVDAVQHPGGDLLVPAIGEGECHVATGCHWAGVDLQVEVALVGPLAGIPRGWVVTGRRCRAPHHYGCEQQRGDRMISHFAGPVHVVWHDVDSQCLTNSRSRCRPPTAPPGPRWNGTSLRHETDARLQER